MIPTSESAAGTDPWVPESNAPFSESLHQFFNYLNKWWWVPLLRAGAGPYVGTPFSGYFVLLETVGRKSGEIRRAPLNYAIDSGSVYLLAGFGTRTAWYLNIQADPAVRVTLPGRAFSGVASTVTDPDERLRMAREVAKNGGFAGFMTGVNPRTAPDELLMKHLAGVPLVRIRPTGIETAPGDPGGRLWIPSLLVQLWLIARVFGWVRNRFR
jgi:deazaflavin-dependent oxidoreductase (nitroreductase family)